MHMTSLVWGRDNGHISIRQRTASSCLLSRDVPSICVTYARLNLEQNRAPLIDGRMPEPGFLARCRATRLEKTQLL